MTTTIEIEIEVLGECLALRGDGTICVAVWDAPPAERKFIQDVGSPEPAW